MLTNEDVIDYVAEATGLTPHKWVVRQTWGPQIVENVFALRPVSVLDLVMYKTTGELPEKRVVPRDRDFWRFPQCSPLKLISVSDLFREYGSRGHYAYPLQDVRAIKHAYWEGDMGLRELSRQYDIAVRQVSRIVHSRSYWYVW